MKRLMFIGIAAVLVLSACSQSGPTAVPPTNPLAVQETAVSPTTPCGDNVCDANEQAHPDLCPLDCASETAPAATTPPIAQSAPPAAASGAEADAYWVTNPTSGARLYTRVVHSQNWNGDPMPTLILVPGGNGSSADFLRPPRESAPTIADGGFTVIIFDPDGRGQSEGSEDQNGFIQQDGLAAVIQFAATLPEVDAERIGLVSFSFGVTMASGALARDPDLPVQFFIDWEGPADRNDTGGCDADQLGHLAGEVACDDEAFWAQREAATFALSLQTPYLRLQSEQDHVQPDVNHALLMIANATGTAYGGNGMASWTRLNDLSPNTVYNADSLPPMIPESEDRQLDALIIQFAQDMFVQTR